MATDIAGICKMEDIQNEVEISTTSKNSDSVDVANQSSVNAISDKQQQISAVIGGQIVESSLKVDINGQTFHIFSPKGDRKQINISSPESMTDVTSDQHAQVKREHEVSSADHGYQVSERKKRSANKRVKPSLVDKGEVVETPSVEILPQSKETTKSGLELKIKIKTNQKVREELQELKLQEKNRKKESQQNRCFDCKKVFANSGELNKHLILKHGAKMVSPKPTGVRIKVSDEAQQQGNTSGQCCGVPVPQNFQDATKKHVCSICDKFYYLESNLERHMLRDHFGDTKMKEYEQVDETKSHNFGYSVDTSNDEDDDDEDDDNDVTDKGVKDYKAMHRQLYFKYNCEICDYKSHYKHNFARHMNLNHGHYGETCKICKISFTSKAQLDNHNKNMHSHTPSKKLRSNVCKTNESTETVSPPEKKRKMYTATYRCEHCNEVFLSLSDLEDHMDYHYAPVVFE